MKAAFVAMGTFYDGSFVKHSMYQTLLHERIVHSTLE